MFAVIFEVAPKPERREDYLREAGVLRPALEQVDGFVANERYRSLGRPGWVLSLSLWRDEKAVVRWRTLARHHEAQQKGRFSFFADYRLRVGEVIGDSGPTAGGRLPQQRLDETECGPARLAIVSERRLAATSDAAAAGLLGAAAAAGAPGFVAADAFRHLARDDTLLLLSWWREAGDGAAWLAGRGDDGARHRQVRIVRDYGMFDRREAPQYYPPVAPG